VFKSILVPIDGSSHSTVALQHALPFARRFEARLTALHVIDAKILEAPYLTDLAGMTGAVPFPGLLSEVRQSLERRGRQILEEFRDTCAEAGVEAQTLLETGIIHDVIAHTAMSHDLICMGRKSGSPAWVGHLLGSTLENTLRRVHVPVLLAGEEYREPRRILAAYDGSLFANAALRVAIPLIEAFGGECTLLAVAPHEDQAVPLLEDARKLLDAHKIRFGQLCRAGDPREQIVTAARETGADLVVMGAFGHGRLHQVLLGSTTDAVMRTCPLPLLIART
jgi:nucleotide-binding universal stress UspA family protein